MMSLNGLEVRSKENIMQLETKEGWDVWRSGIPTLEHPAYLLIIDNKMPLGHAVSLETNIDFV